VNSVRENIKRKIAAAKPISYTNQVSGFIAVTGLVVSLFLILVGILVIPLTVIVTNSNDNIVVPKSLAADPVSTQLYLSAVSAQKSSFGEVVTYTGSLLAFASTVVAVLSSWRPSSGMMVDNSTMKAVNDAFIAGRRKEDSVDVESGVKLE
jgi:hypothetical protein